VRMGDSPLLRASSEASAARLCAELRALAQAPANERRSLARERLRALLASDGLAARIARVRRATLVHRGWTGLAIGAVFGAPPVLALGVGAGWMGEEFDLLGVPFEKRGARLGHGVWDLAFRRR